MFLFNMSVICKIISVLLTRVFYYQDFAFDLCALLDIFATIKMVMEALQSFSLQSLKIFYLECLMQHRKHMDIEKRVGMPTLSENAEDLENHKFKGIYYT